MARSPAYGAYVNREVECSEPGCERPAVAREACQYHYRHLRDSEQPICEVDGCSKRSNARGLCPAHYTRRWNLEHDAAKWRDSLGWAKYVLAMARERER